MNYTYLTLIGLFLNLSLTSQSNILSNVTYGGEEIKLVENVDSINVMIKDSVLFKVSKENAINSNFIFSFIGERMFIKRGKMIFELLYSTQIGKGSLAIGLHILNKENTGIDKTTEFIDVIENTSFSHSLLHSIEYTAKNGLFIVVKSSLGARFIIAREMDNDLSVEFLKTKVPFDHKK